MKEIEIFAQAESESAEVYIYDFIGDDGFGGGVSAKGFAERLDKFGPLDEITVRINSPGGSAWDGAAIYNALVRHPAKVKVSIDGIAASAASFIAMAGDEIEIAENANMMIHSASGLVYGPAVEMEKTAVILRKLDDQIASMYARRTHRNAETFLKLMAEETWFDAEEAVKNRLADRIAQNKEKPEAVALFGAEIWNKVSRRPEKIAAVAKPTNIEPYYFEPEPIALAEPENPAPPVIDVDAALAGYAARIAELQA